MPSNTFRPVVTGANFVSFSIPTTRVAGWISACGGPGSAQGHPALLIR